METILIQNFKAIKNTAKREIKIANLTLLIGEQATGKSTVAKLVYFFKKLPEEILFELIKNPEITNENFKETIENCLRLLFLRLFGDPIFLNNFKIEYKFKNSFLLKIKKNKNIGTFEMIWPSENFIYDLRDQWLPIYQEMISMNENYDIVSQAKQERLIAKLARHIGDLFSYDYITLYVPASRNVVVSMENQLLEIFSKLDRLYFTNEYIHSSENEYIIYKFIKYIQIIKSRFYGKGFDELIQNTNNTISDEIISEILIQITKILVGNYRNSQSGERIYYSNSENYTPLENSSSGQQEAIRIIQDIFLEVLEARPVFRVYEEPESHLSPVGQLGIIQLIAMLANRNPDNQIIIPTHTPYLLSEVSNMMRASKIVADNPDLKEEVSAILKPFYWLNFESVSAYQLTREGEIEDVKDEEYQMIDGKLFDKVTNEISDQFDQLLSLQYEQ